MKSSNYLAALLIAAVLPRAALAQTMMALDWTERQEPNAGLTAHDDTLLGDSIDPRSGRLTFEQVDVSLPGNFALPVEMRRRLNPSQMQSGEFSDWQLAIPTISTKILDDEWYAGKRWGKTRCSGTLASAIPQASWPTHWGGSAIPPGKYSDGVILDIPGRATSQVLDKTVAAGWPASAAKVTVDGWYLECIPNIDGAGTQGFRAIAPNGDRYTLDFAIDPGYRKSEFDIWQAVSMPTGPSVNWTKMGVHYDILAVSEVTDVNGNWVRYAYDANKRLKSITSSDGRRIDIARTYALISSVTANPDTAYARQWTYQYGYKAVTSFKPPDLVNGAPGMGSETWGSLKSVTLPNGRQWLFDLANLQARPVPGSDYGGWKCKQLNQAVTVTHPDGVKGAFTLEEFQLHLGAGATGASGPYCPNSNQGGAPSAQVADVMAVTSKTLSSPTMASALWQYSYFDTGTQIITTIRQPDNSRRVIYQPTPFDWASPRPHAERTKVEVYADMAATAPLQVTTYAYLQEPAAGSIFVDNSIQDTYKPLRVSETTIARAPDSYTTRATFNLDRSSGTYSYGFPIRVEEFSSLGGVTRLTDVVYAHNTNAWILGLPASVTKNGKLFDAFQYDSQGRVVRRDRFGSLSQTYGYSSGADSAGTPAWEKDALNRTTSFRQWKRGIPQEVERADGAKLLRSVDDNGWTRGITDWRGTTTNYAYDSVGRLTTIDRPAPWTDTTLSYSYPVAGLVQTQTFGTQRATTTYDAMLRPTQVLKESLNGPGGSIYMQTTYDAAGRAAFTSLPAATAGSTIGYQFSFDALGRITQTTETASGGGITRYEYLAGNKTRVTNPVGNATTYTTRAWGDPDDGDIIRVEKPENIVVDYSWDNYGDLLSIAQTRNDGAQQVSSFEYDASLRLCRRKVLEAGDTLYAYNSADDLISYAEGQASGSGCSVPPATAAVGLGYDLAGRMTLTDFPGSTPDIARTFDANGNVLSVDRGGARWAYTYNALDLPEIETLSIDGRTYQIDPTYGPEGSLISKRFPSGRTYTYSNDGHGRPTAISFGAIAYLSNATYHPNGALAMLSRGTGGVYQQLLNARQLVSQIGGNWGTALTYAYDTAGRVTSIDSVDSNNKRTFTYDGVGRVKSATGPWGAGTYSYDRLGNLLQKVEGPRTVDIQYSTNNRVASVRDSAVSSSWRNYTHDARGNVIGDGLHTFVYDDANQPASIAGADNGSFLYDGAFRRVKQVIDGTTIYSLYDQSGALLTRDNASTGQVTDFLNLGGKTFVRVVNGTPWYPLNDQLGSAYMVADQSGSVPASGTYRFTPYGETLGNDPGASNQQGFTGHIEDETGLTYMQARYYDPVIGRFLSPDPLGYADQLNLYAYVGGDPVNRSDPSGLCGFCAFGRFPGVLRPLTQGVRQALRESQGRPRVAPEEKLPGPRYASPNEGETGEQLMKRLQKWREDDFARLVEEVRQPEPLPKGVPDKPLWFLTLDVVRELLDIFTHKNFSVTIVPVDDNGNEVPIEEENGSSDDSGPADGTCQVIPDPLGGGELVGDCTAQVWEKEACGSLPSSSAQSPAMPGRSCQLQSTTWNRPIKGDMTPRPFIGHAARGRVENPGDTFLRLTSSSPMSRPPRDGSRFSRPTGPRRMPEMQMASRQLPGALNKAWESSRTWSANGTG